MPPNSVVQADAQIEAYLDCAEQWRKHVSLEAYGLAHGVKVKYAAIRRLMEQKNELTGQPHSASSAEKFVELDPEFSKHLELQREIVASKNEQHARMSAAWLTALLRIGEVFAEAPLHLEISPAPSQPTVRT